MTDEQVRKKRRGQIQAILLMLVVALPMLAAYVIYHTGWGMPTGTVNKGALLEPARHLPDIQPRLADDSAWDISAEKKRWRYVIPGFSTCDEQCMKNLYLTRQVHIRLNDKADRVERIYLLQDETLSPELSAHIEQEHPLLRVMRVQASSLDTLLEDTNLSGDAVAAGRYFLMDQDGFLMMAYSPQHTGGELLKDVKKMLKTSYEE
ncbi:hypothetical protein [Gilvimarinus algae]|uniref:Uncharacterized protein n=1 Tax=Gilvimarinus algae TaxID=3058037 RepID=A0ABT8TCS6_9GAMM|nr:hypothetical protein [Gilvimarinus sp. SDUM040014]MDO3381741.1 hypothetical protein [Gilvimarinus sp. SDUM040014]